MKKLRFVLLSGLLSVSTAWAMGKAPTKTEQESVQATKQTCEQVLGVFNQTQLKNQIDVAQLSKIVRHLDQHSRLPDYFITKNQASQWGWSPGIYFNSVSALKGKSIGGDRFGNFEKRLPTGQWQEADLDYRGKKRNAKRLVFSQNGERFVTIDHYESFKKVPTCQ